MQDKTSIDLGGKRTRPYKNYCWVSACAGATFIFRSPFSLARRDGHRPKYKLPNSPTRVHQWQGLEPPVPSQGRAVPSGRSAAHLPARAAQTHSQSSPPPLPCAAVGRRKGTRVAAPRCQQLLTVEAGAGPVDSKTDGQRC